VIAEALRVDLVDEGEIADVGEEHRGLDHVIEPVGYQKSLMAIDQGVPRCLSGLRFPVLVGRRRRAWWSDPSFTWR